MQPDRLKTALDAFGWGQAEVTSLPADASKRRYHRLKRGTETRILMDAPPESGEALHPFLSVDHALADRGFSVPQIFASDVENGFVLLEDFGDDLFFDVLAHDLTQEGRLYRSAVELLIQLQDRSVFASSVYGLHEMCEAAQLAPIWYGSGTQSAALDKVLKACLAPYFKEPPVTVLRDFHAQNLVWLPDREGVRKCGLLDFQDAANGHWAYDLGSLLFDVRRDVSVSVIDDCIRFFAEGTSRSKDEVTIATHAVSLQRGIRILGIFARLAIHYHRPRYLSYLPKVWSVIDTNLAVLGDEELSTVIQQTLSRDMTDLDDRVRKASADHA